MPSTPDAIDQGRTKFCESVGGPPQFHSAFAQGLSLARNAIDGATKINWTRSGKTELKSWCPSSANRSCTLKRGTLMRAHHIATAWNRTVPDGGNVVEVGTIENDLIDNDVCHRAVAGACQGDSLFQEPISWSTGQSDLRL